MYLTVLEYSMGCVLGKHDESGRKEHVVYYLSKKFTDCETRYSLLEKTCCTLASTAHRLRQYMLTHTTLLIPKIGSDKIHLREACSFWENSEMAGDPDRVLYTVYYPESYKGKCAS